MSNGPRRQITRDQALEAAWNLAHALDLDDDLRILSDRGNLIVLFGNDPVVGRIAHLTAFTRRDPVAWMQREVDVAKALFMYGAPVVPPVAALPIGPHIVYDVPITLWEYDPPREIELTASDVAWSYCKLYNKLLDPHLPDLPWFTPVTEQIPEGIEALAEVNAIEPDILSTLQKEHERLVMEFLPSKGISHLIHGDAHPGNLVSTSRGYVWLDFEEACAGPIEWDLACLFQTRRMDGQQILKHFIEEIDYPIVSEEDLRPYIRARELEATVWLLGMAYQLPERYQADANASLNRFLSSTER